MSREIDARVAVEVMGAVWSHEPAWPGGPADWLHFHGKNGVLAERRRDDGRMCYPANLPRYSTDIAAAWEVVEKMQADNPGWRFCLLGGDEPFGMVRVPNPDGMTRYATDPHHRRTPFGWRASFFGHEDPEISTGERHADEHADTAPMATCLAALKAVERTPTNSHPEPSAPSHVTPTEEPSNGR
ncbi:MAG: hypothetical protein ABL993_02435 [Vicinamibacterales bacterium]